MLAGGSANKERGEDELQVEEEPSFIWSRIGIRKFRLDAVVIKENGNKKGTKWGLFDEGFEERMILQRCKGKSEPPLVVNYVERGEILTG